MKPEKFIQSIIDKYQITLRLLEVTFNIEKDDEYYLACKFRYPYTDSIIYYSTGFEKDLRNKDFEKCERRIVHEMLHQLTDPLYSKATSRWAGEREVEDERERLTDRIATIVFDLMNKV